MFQGLFKFSVSRRADTSSRDINYVVSILGCTALPGLLLSLYGPGLGQLVMTMRTTKYTQVTPTICGEFVYTVKYKISSLILEKKKTVLAPKKGGKSYQAY